MLEEKKFFLSLPASTCFRSFPQQGGKVTRKEDECVDKCDLRVNSVSDILHTWDAFILICNYLINY